MALGYSTQREQRLTGGGALRVMNLHLMISAPTAQLWLPAVLITIILVLWARSYLERRALLRLARHAGGSYDRRHDETLRRRFEGLCVFGRGHSQRVVDVVRDSGDLGPITAFRLITELGSRGRRGICQYAVVVVETTTAVHHVVCGCRLGRALPGDLPTELMEHFSKQASTCVYVAPQDASDPRLERLQRWMSHRHPDMFWQVTPRCIVGACPYTRDVRTTLRLWRSTQTLARLLSK